MTDFALRAADEPTMNAIMRATYEIVSGRTLAPDEPTPTQGRSATGTEWFLDVIGTFWEPTGDFTEGPDGGQVPVMAARPGFHVMLRWNGGDEIPPEHPALEIVWRSDSGEPLPEWWTRVVA